MLVDKVQVEVSIAGIIVFDIGAAKAIEATIVVVDITIVDLTIISHQCKLDQVLDTLNQCKSESFQ